MVREFLDVRYHRNGVGGESFYLTNGAAGVSHRVELPVCGQTRRDTLCVT